MTGSSVATSGTAMMPIGVLSSYRPASMPFSNSSVKGGSAAAPSSTSKASLSVRMLYSLSYTLTHTSPKSPRRFSIAGSSTVSVPAGT